VFLKSNYFTNSINALETQYVYCEVGTEFFNIRLQRTASVVLWSEFLATDPEARFRFPALSDFLEKKKKKKKQVVGLEQGPLSLASTTEELLDRKVAAPV
jgi:hypothetical protein